MACYDEPFWKSPSAKFIIVPTRPMEAVDIVSLLRLFMTIKRLNAVILLVEDEIAVLEILKPRLDGLEPTTDVDVVFPDKLKNLNQYTYKAVGFDQKPRLFRRNGKFYGFDVFFLEIVAKLQNASFVIDFYDLKNPKDKSKVLSELLEGKIDIVLSTMNSVGNFGNHQKELSAFNTYDVGGYCALIPIPPRNSFFKYLLVPYDWISWMFMVLSLVALAVVWRIFRLQRDGRDLSPVSHMILRVVAGFLGQAFDFRHTRWFHVMIMQIFIFMVLILGNAYQSLLISLLTVSRNGTRISTVNEMMQGRYNFISDKIFHLIITEFDGNNSILTKLEKDTNMYDVQSIDYEAKATNNSVLIMRCDAASSIFYTDNNKFQRGNPSDFYYILPEKFFTLYEMLTTGRMSPFTERFGEISLKIFESGIRQYWATLLHKLSDHIDLTQISIVKEEYLLKMDDLKYVFYIWGIGMLVASAAFGLELLCYKHRKYLRKTLIMRLIRKLTWEERMQRRELRILMRWRRIRIQPFVL